MTIDKLFKKNLVVKSQTLKPVVILGDKGLTENVIHEIDLALTAHELIKVRVNAADREAREALTTEICEATQSELIQKIGHVISIYRKKPAGK